MIRIPTQIRSRGFPFPPGFSVLLILALLGTGLSFLFGAVEGSFMLGFLSTSLFFACLSYGCLRWVASKGATKPGPIAQAVRATVSFGMVFLLLAGICALGVWATLPEPNSGIEGPVSLMRSYTAGVHLGALAFAQMFLVLGVLVLLFLPVAIYRSSKQGRVAAPPENSCVEQGSGDSGAAQ